MEVYTMSNLETTYMGIPVENPIIAGASALSGNMKNIKRLEFAGVGAIVIKSLFEEEIEMQRFAFEEEMHSFDELHAEMTSLHPNIEFKGAKEHLYWLKKAKAKTRVPIIASLNAHQRETWVEYSQAIEKTGVDGIELNFYTFPKDRDISSKEIEDEQVETLKAVKSAVNLPVSVKLSPFYTNIRSFVHRLDGAGADAIILFNRLFQPEVDIEDEDEVISFQFSSETDNLLTLRWIALLSEETKCDLIANTGIINGEDVIKMLLVGAQATQVVSTLYKNGMDHVEVMRKEVDSWMERKGYESLRDYRGKMNKAHSKDPWAYERNQYIKMLLSKETL